MWIFGYGSLVWKADFPFEEKVIGYIQGFQRRFYQHSTDHRGVPDKPGRVVTLIPTTWTDRVYGIAYRIHEHHRESVINHLDFREKGGYQRVPVKFYVKDKDEQHDITIYIANNNNPQYAGPADIDSIASQVVKSVGPSGTNIEYVFNLAEAMRNIAPDVYDDHLFNLENRVKTLLNFDNADDNQGF